MDHFFVAQSLSVPFQLYFFQMRYALKTQQALVALGILPLHHLAKPRRLDLGDRPRVLRPVPGGVDAVVERGEIGRRLGGRSDVRGIRITFHWDPVVARRVGVAPRRRRGLALGRLHALEAPRCRGAGSHATAGCPTNRFRGARMQGRREQVTCVSYASAA